MNSGFLASLRLWRSLSDISIDDTRLPEHSQSLGTDLSSIAQELLRDLTSRAKSLFHGQISHEPLRHPGLCCYKDVFMGIDNGHD